MFLKRLELQGFKSFASKTTLDFPAGIAAIVGPNGSGKSNITDAIRWLLGEREAKNLRGGKADDLIFAGTEKRPRAGLAQATICFDNSSGFFPTEFGEVAITRRISRDGDSKFFLNDEEVRLKDVIDFFARSKLGARGMNIIGQGDSDMILKASPLERREMVEETLGLKEFILKKNSAERELKNTSINLEKARALLEEIKPHLRLLRRQIGRYRERENLAEELFSWEKKYFGGKAAGLNRDEAELEPSLKQFDGKLQQEREKLALAERELNETEKTAPKSRSELGGISEERRRLINQMREEAAAVARPIKSEKKSAEEIIDQIKQAAAEAISGPVEKIQAALRRIIELADSFATKEPVELKVAKDQEINRLLDELDRREKKCMNDLEEFNRVFREQVKGVSGIKAVIEELEGKRARIIFEKERIKIRREELINQIEAAGRRPADFFGEEEVPGAAEEDIERKIYRLRSELANIGEIDETILKEADETESRHEFLVKEIADLEKASADLKILIKDLEQKIHRDFSGALASINRELNSFAKQMFGGGKAALKLQEKKSIATAEPEEGSVGQPEEERQGLEIEVALPKKRVKGLEVLSGGERSLLAASILFALVSVSPPPFLVLDEIDAALDERNARRFGEMLKNFAAKTQSIIITHNRATMEAADVLYGVTMAEDGASRLVSLKLV
jgi:chromosome segregation protein